MTNIAKIGEKAPALLLSEWLQGDSVQLQQLLGKVVLIEVFQVNCPGCFIYSLPVAVDLYQRYRDKGLYVIGVATAFEDFDKNNLHNLRCLLEENKVIGETFRVLDQEQLLFNGRLTYSLPFPVAMDSIEQQPQQDITEVDITALIKQHVASFEDKSDVEKEHIHAQAYSYLQSLKYKAETFHRYQLQGTPSHIVIDKEGMLKASKFGHFPELEALIVNEINTNYAGSRYTDNRP